MAVILRRGKLMRITADADTVNFLLSDGWQIVSVFAVGKRRQLWGADAAGR